MTIDGIIIVYRCFKKVVSKKYYCCDPYYGYARQDRKVVPRTSISAKVVANLITNAEQVEW